MPRSTRTLDGAATPARPPRLGPASSTSLITRTFERLQSDIVHGQLRPGTRLKIEMLQDRYGCGATPLREALTLLCNTGMVRRVEQRGFHVAPIGLDDYSELMRTRCFLEERALREAIRYGGADWEERIVLAQFHLRKGEEDWEARHGLFHAALISASPSKRLLGFCAQLYAESNRYRYIARHGPGGRPGSYEEHRRIADAVLGRDSDFAVSCLLEHYQRTADLLAQALGTWLNPAATAEADAPPQAPLLEEN